MKRFFNFLGFKTENEIINDMFNEDKDTWVFPTSSYKPGKITIVPKGVEIDPSGRPLNSPGAKADAGKLRPWLVLGQFSHALEEVTKVGTAGAKKYTPNGWLTVPEAEERYMDAFARHMLEVGKGNKMDDGPSGVGTMHLANMVWNLLAVLELQLRNEKSSNKT
jgi:hypothetical protein